MKKENDMNDIRQTLPHGTLKAFSSLTGIPVSHLSGYLSGSRPMSKTRALFLEQASLTLGYTFTAIDWMFNPKKIKATLINNAHPVPSQDTRKVLETVN